MKNIMLIVITTLTIATANATWFQWSPSRPLQIVNHTPVTLEFRTETDNLFFTLNSGESFYASNVGVDSTYVGWGINKDTDIPPIFTQWFNNIAPTGTLSTTINVISGSINLGQVWALGDVGYNDILILTGVENGNTMQLTATRQRGVNIERSQGDTQAAADLYCLSTGVEFSLSSEGDSERCPVGESDVVIANDNYIQDFSSVDAWAPSDLKSHVNTVCNGTVTCWNNPTYDPQSPLPGVEVYNVDSIAYTSNYQMLYIGI